MTFQLVICFEPHSRPTVEHLKLVFIQYDFLGTVSWDSEHHCPPKSDAPAVDSVNQCTGDPQFVDHKSSVSIKRSNAAYDRRLQACKQASELFPKSSTIRMKLNNWKNIEHYGFHIRSASAGLCPDQPTRLFDVNLWNQLYRLKHTATLGSSESEHQLSQAAAT